MLLVLLQGCQGQEAARSQSGDSALLPVPPGTPRPPVSTPTIPTPPASVEPPVTADQVGSEQALDPALYVLPDEGETCLPRKRGSTTVVGVLFPRSPRCTTQHEAVYHQVYCELDGEMVFYQGSLEPDSLFLSDDGELCGVSDKEPTNYCYRPAGWAVADEYCVDQD